MQELTDKQLFEALDHARNQDEQAGQVILGRFQTRQPAFAQTLFSVFPSVIVDMDQGMAHLFMDLCFDVIAVYEHAFGKVPDQRIVGSRWIDGIVKQFDPDMNLAKRHVKPNALAHTREQEHQMGLVNFLHQAIDQQPCASDAAVRFTKMMVFITVQLFDALYDEAFENQFQAMH